MVKVLVLYGIPIDRAAFDGYFATHHRRRLLAVPNLQKLVVNRIAGAAKGDSPFHLVVELQFDSEEAMQEGLNSRAGQAMARDLGQLATGGVTVLIAQATSESS